MAKPLKLEVLLGAIDKATGPLKKITQGSDATAQALKASREQLRGLQQQQKDVRGYREGVVAMRRHERALRDLQADTQRYTDAMDEQNERHVNLKANLKNAQRQYDKLSKAIINTTEPNKQLSHELDKARIALASQHQAYEKSSHAINKYREQVKRSEQQTEHLTRAQRDQQEHLNGLKRRLDDAGIETDSLGRKAQALRGDEERLNTTLEEQQAKLKAVTTQQRHLTAARDHYQRVTSQASRMVGVGAGGLAVGGAALYGGAGMLSPGIDYGAQMSAVQAVGRFEKGDSRFQALKDQSRELGASTAFSATEVGSGQEFLLRAGMSAEAIKASMGDVLNLALANNTELGRAADIASNIAGTFKIDMEADGSMGRVADILSGTASRANVDLEMLGETMKYLGGAEDLNLTMEQAAAMSGLLGNIGIQASQAGTTMRAMMNRLTDPAKAGADAMKSIGLQVADANGNMRAMPDILRDINKATTDLGNVERKAILQKIFGAEAGSGMAELVSGMSSGQLDALIASLGENYGENARMAKTMSDNIQGDLDGLSSAWEEIGITLTETNKGPLRDLIQKATEVVRVIGVWMNENPELTGQIAIVAGGIAALVAVGGALTLALGSILGPIAAVRYALTLLSLNPATLTIMAIVAAAAALATGAYAVYRNWDKISAWFGQRWTEVKAAFDAGIGGITRLLADWSPLGLLWKGITDGLSAMGVEVPAQFTTLGSAIVDGLFVGMKEIFSGGWAEITAAFDGGIEGVTRLLLDWSPIGLIYRGITAGLSAMGVELPASFTTFGSAIIDGIIGGVTGGLSRLGDTIAGMGEGIKNWFKDALGINSPSRVFAGFGANLLEGLINGIDAGWQTLKDTIGNTADAVVGWFKDKLGINSPSRVFAELGIHTIDGLNVGLDRQRDEPAKRVRDIAQRVRQAGAGIALGAITLPAAAALPVNIPITNSPILPSVADVQIDRRPALSSPTSNAQPSGDTITINVYGAPGQDTTALAREINRLLEERDRNQAARRRSSLRDID